MKTLFLPLLLFSLLLSGAGAKSSRAPGAVPDTSGADSAAVQVDSGQGPARSDSTHPQRVDPACAWKTWKDLSRAIGLRPLDGPEDILEKAEIIEDRLDDLRQEQGKLEASSKEWTDRRQALEDQLEVLADLAEVQQGGDLQMQQRLDGLRQNLREAVQRLGIVAGSLGDLQKELDRLTVLVKQYKDKAEELHRREEKDR